MELQRRIASWEEQQAENATSTETGGNSLEQADALLAASLEVAATAPSPPTGSLSSRDRDDDVDSIAVARYEGIFQKLERQAAGEASGANSGLGADGAAPHEDAMASADDGIIVVLSPVNSTPCKTIGHNDWVLPYVILCCV